MAGPTTVVADLPRPVSAAGSAVGVGGAGGAVVARLAAGAGGGSAGPAVTAGTAVTAEGGGYRRWTAASTPELTGEAAAVGAQVADAWRTDTNA
ncbi:hypothetical protein [Mycobacterium sp.]|uniref:hypothetical protein n=1 Tax=Mycobacterium sp. TaxID=1785 RepID=UPI003F9615A5